MGRFERGVAKLAHAEAHVDPLIDHEGIEEYIRRRLTKALNEKLDGAGVPRPEWCPLCGDHHLGHDLECPIPLDELVAMDGLT
jgi:hypothetical protein